MPARVALCLNGSENQIALSIRAFRRAGLPIVSWNDLPGLDGYYYVSSRELMDAWQGSLRIPPFLPDCDLYFLAREQDIELIILSAHGKVTIMDRAAAKHSVVAE
jgi:hypothetical protein